MAGNISSPVLGDKVQTSRNRDGLFVRNMEKILILEEKINREIDALVDLKSQMRDVIAAVQDYIHNLTWEQIGNELNADKSTIRRWHGSALAHVVLPENPIKIF